MKRYVLLFVLLGLSCAPLAAEDVAHPQEELTEQQLGTVHFPVSCSASVQKSFERGVALLHSFWYEEAQKQFEQIAREDARCAMAHWGTAMSLWHQLWNHPDRPVLQRGQAELKQARALRPPTDRERALIAALGAFYKGKPDHEARAKAYSAAMENLYQKYPDDHEAAVFYALSLLASDPGDDATFAARKKAAAILETLFAAEPNHPGVAHYLIHAYDVPQLAPLGLPAARRYAEVAPAAPHALHMPSHIFARLGLWQDDIDSNLASLAATRKTAAMHMGGEGHQFHAMDFLFYAYLQSGREADAKALIDQVQGMAPMHDMYGMGFDPRRATLVHFTALYPLELRHWSAAAALPPLEVPGTAEASTLYWARAMASAHLGKVADVRQDVEQIDVVHKKMLAAKNKEGEEAVEHDYQQATAWLRFAEGKYEEAVAILRPVADREDSLGEEPQGIPTREMIADMLLESRRPEAALAEYQTDLKLNPNRFNALYGAARAAQQAGQQDEAASYFAQLVRVCLGSNSQRPELAQANGLAAKR
jgi:hypothetical protein